MDKKLSLLERTAGWAASHLFPVGKWYETNRYYRFKKGYLVELKRRNIFGYGVQPKGKVIEYKEGGVFGDRYIIEMERFIVESNDAYDEWVKTGKIPENAKKERKIEEHFKGNIEFHFKKQQNFQIQF